MTDNDNKCQSENPAEPITIQERIRKLASAEEKIIAALAVAGVASTGQIWRFAEMEKTNVSRDEFVRRLVNLCEHREEIGVVTGIKLPREMAGSIVPEAWYLTDSGLARIKQFSPFLSRYAVTGLPCGKKLNRLPHELLVTESLLYLMGTEAVLEYKPERILKRELVLERFAREERRLNETEIQQVLNDVRGEETGDFKVRIFDPDPFFDGPDVREIECETAVRYRGKVIRKKPERMQWFAGAQGQADLIEVNQPDRIGHPVVLGEVSRPFFISVISSYRSRKNSDRPEFEKLKEAAREQIIEEMDLPRALELIAELVSDDTPDPKKTIVKVRQTLQRHALWRAENYPEGIRRLEDGSLILTPETARLVRDMVQAGAGEPPETSADDKKNTRKIPRTADDQGTQSGVIDDEFGAVCRNRMVDGEDMESVDGTSEEIRNRSLCSLQSGESFDQQIESDEDRSQDSNTLLNKPADSDEPLQDDDEIDNSFGLFRQNYRYVTDPTGAAPLIKSPRETHIRVLNNAGQISRLTKPKSKSRPGTERKILSELGRFDALTRGALATLTRVRINEISSTLKLMSEQEKVNYADVSINPGTKKYRPPRLFRTGYGVFNSWTERIAHVLLSIMIEQFHNKDYRFSKTDGGWSEYVVFARRLPPESEIFVILDAPIKAKTSIFYDYEREMNESGGAAKDIKIATYSSARFAEIREKLAHVRIYDAEKKQWN